MWSGGKNEKTRILPEKSGKSIQRKPRIILYPKKKKINEIYADVKTAQIESKQAIGFPRLALKSQVSSLEHN